MKKVKPKNPRVIWAVDPFIKEKKILKDTLLAIQALTRRRALTIEPVYIGGPSILADPLSSKGENLHDLCSYGQIEMDKVLSGIKFPGLQRLNILLAEEGSTHNKVSTLLKYAKRRRADLVVAGTHAYRGPKRWIMGSFSETLSLSSDISLLIVNPFWRPIRQFKSILFATDFSDESRVAYEKVLSLAKQLKSRVLILHRSEGIDEETKVQRTSALQWAKKGQKEGIKCHVIIDSKWGESPAETILRRASQLPGMIAMAAYSGPVSRALLGSTTRKVIRFSTQPVWVIHPQRRKQIELFREENQSLLPNREAA